MRVGLLSSDFNEINRSGYTLIANGQSMKNKPQISGDYWIIRAYLCNTGYFLVEVCNMNGDRARRISNAGLWKDWIYD